MPKYRVLRPIEHDQKLYLPEDLNAPKTVLGASHGREVPVDASGVIELSEEDAAALDLGQVQPQHSPPKTLEGGERPRGKE